MRVIYLDEAGTSELEKLRVVAGVIVDPDTQYFPAVNRIQEILSKVPKAITLNKPYIFHAKTIRSANRELWSEHDQLDLMHEMMQVAQTLRLSLVFSVVRAELQLSKFIENDKFTNAQRQYMYAFHRCVGAANSYLRDQNECGSVVAENVLGSVQTEMKRIIQIAQHSPYISEKETQMRAKPGEPMRADGPPGDVSVSTDRIIDTVHFVIKSESPLIQLADAVSFGLRRFFSREDVGTRYEFGRKFARSILGTDDLDAYLENLGPAGRGLVLFE